MHKKRYYTLDNSPNTKNNHSSILPHIRPNHCLANFQTQLSKSIQHQRRINKISSQQKRRQSMISQMKKKTIELRNRYIENSQRNYDKICEVLQRVAEKINKPVQRQSQNFPIFYPIYQNMNRRSQSPYEKTQLRDKRKKHNSRKYRHPLNKEHLRKRLRKAFICVFFICVLKKYCNNIKKHRLQYFNEIWPQNFHNVMSNTRQSLKKMCVNFFKGCHENRYQDLSIRDDDPIQQKHDKMKKIKRLIGQLLDGVNDAFMSKDTISEELQNLLHIFCKHGAFLCNGVITVEQMRYVCYSTANRYCTFNDILEKVQIVHFFFLKILIYNVILLNYRTMWNNNIQRDENYIAYNLYFLGSIMYHICVDVRDSLLQQNTQLSDSYPLNNWKNIKPKVQSCPSLRNGDSHVSDGQIISGLLPRAKFQKYFNPAFFQNQQQIIKNIVQNIYERMRNTHKEYKKMAFKFK